MSAKEQVDPLHCALLYMVHADLHLSQLKPSVCIQHIEKLHAGFVAEAIIFQVEMLQGCVVPNEILQGLSTLVANDIATQV